MTVPILRQVTRCGVVLALAVTASLGTTVSAAKPQPFAVTVLVAESRTVVEPQSSDDNIVTNPTPCAWNIDDKIRFGASGQPMLPGTVSATACLIADDAHRVTGLSIQSSSPDLIVTLRFERWDTEWRFVARPVGGNYVYQGCVAGPRLADPSWGEPIEGSNGWGLRSDVTVSITNPTTRNIRDSGGQIELGSDAPGYWRGEQCQTRSGWFHQAGALWDVGL